MKSIYKYPLFALGALLSFSNCSKLKCDGPDKNQTFTHNFETKELNKVPYKGNDTLYFLNKQGDTCIVRGTGKRYYEDQATQLLGSLDCGYPNQIDNYQAYEISFIPIKGNMQFVFTQAKHYEVIEINLDNGKYNQPYFQMNYNRMDWSDDRIDSIMLNNIQYRNVYQFSAYDSDKGAIDTTYKALINSTEGVLYLMSERDNKEFSIIKKP